MTARRELWRWKTDRIGFPSLSALFGQRGKPGLSERKPWEPYDGKLFMFVFSDSVAMLQFTGVCHLSTVRAELAYLCLWQPFLGVWSHMGWLSLARWGMWLPVWKQGVGEQGQGGWEGGWGKVACSDCTAVLVFVTSRRAAVESGPELTRGGGSRELSPRGQQWGGGSSGQIFLLLLLLSLFLLLLFLQLTSILLFLSLQGLCSCSRLFPGCDQRRWWLALERWGLLLPPGGTLVPVLYDLLVWPQPTAQAAPAGEQGAHFKRENSTSTRNKDWSLPK